MREQKTTQQKCQGNADTFQKEIKHFKYFRFLENNNAIYLRQHIYSTRITV